MHGPASAEGIGETPDTLARGGVMEPAARTVASGPEWPVRAGGRGWAVSRHSPGGSGGPCIRSAPTGVGGPCARVLQGAQPEADCRVFGLAPLYMYRGVRHGDGLFGSPCRQASGLSSPVGQVAVACACALVDLRVFVCRAPSVSRRGCHGLALGGWGSLRFSAHGGRGHGVGLVATEDSGARLVYSRLTLGRAGRAWACGREGGGGGGAALAKVFRQTRCAGGKN